MRRYALIVLTSVSLLLCVAVGALWARSYWVQPPREIDVFPLHGHHWRLVSDRGTFRIEYWRRDDERRRRLAEAHQRATEEAERIRIEQREAMRLRGSNGAGTDADADVNARARSMGQKIRAIETGLREWRLRERTPRIRTRVMPFWAPAAACLAAAAPGVAAWVVAARRRRQNRLRGERRCLHCGYDLRASPGRCPECGATPS